ncbi:MAG: hydroxymethylbilane synthase [Candidatus Hydrogenedentes bacterium]|nr:hydroxymethylbilane synthase [Candidatus Hydrogenedentota bacterium]
MKHVLMLGSRGSLLALTQSRWAAARLMELAPEIAVEIKIIKTSGDSMAHQPLSQIGGKGLFTKELESALLNREIAFAVHSMKDLPTQLPEGLTIAATPPREMPNDAFVSSRYASVKDLPMGAKVGTSSLRRSAQLLAFRPDLTIVNLRGNVDTRLKRVEEGTVDAAVLACAGLHRLGRANLITDVIPVDVMIPAVGQGALGIEARADDGDTLAHLQHLNDAATESEVQAERALLAALEGGCQVPIGALARRVGDELTMTACVCSRDGRTVMKAQAHGPASHPADLGERAAEDLLRQGAGELISTIR